MIPRDEQPHLRAMCKDGSHWVIAFEEREAFLTALMAGKAWYVGHCAWGSDITVKLADVTGTSLWDENRLALAEEERAIKKARELTEGAA